MKSLVLFCSAFLLLTLFISGCGSKPLTIQSGSKTSIVSDDEAKAVGQKLFDLATTKCGDQYIWSLSGLNTFKTYELVAVPESLAIAKRDDSGLVVGDARGQTFRGVRWRGEIDVNTSDLSEAEHQKIDVKHDQSATTEVLKVLNRGGHWYYVHDNQLIPIEDLQHIEDSCDSLKKN